MSASLVKPDKGQSRSSQWWWGLAIVVPIGLLGFTVLLWPNLLRVAFNTKFLPHLYCYLGKPGLVWTHVIADALIALSYIAISATLAYVVRVSWKDIPFPRMFLAFGVFIIACGFTHFLEVVTVWIPVYVLSGAVKVFTALASLTTAVLLPLTVKPVGELLNQAKRSEEHRRLLESALSERNAAQATLQESHKKLEVAVQQRTHELAEINRQLKSEIAERNRAEASLASLAAIVEFSDDAIIGKSFEGIITSWNRGAEQLYQYAASEVIGKHISVLFPDERKHELEEILQRVRRGEQIQHFETVRVRKDGTLLDVSLTVSPIKNPNGDIVGMSAIGRDITPQKRSEEALRHSEERYRLLFHSNPLPMWVFDCQTLAFITVNEAAITHYGFSREEFLRMTIRDIRPPQDVVKLLKATSRPLKGLGNVELWRHRKKDGTIIDVEITSHSLSLNGREAELVLAHDVSERVRSEEKLRESEERFAKAFRSSPLPITISTLQEGRYVDVNDAFSKMLGYTHDETIGHTAIDLRFWPSPRDRERFVQQLQNFGRVNFFETQLLPKDGEPRAVQISAELLQFGETPCVLAISNDVTEQKRLEQQLRQAQKMEAVGRLAGGVAHDFNNVLGVIIGYSELAQEKLDQGHIVRKHVVEIRKAADRAVSLTRQLLAFSRQQILQPTILNLNTVIEALSSMLKRLVAEDVQVTFLPGSALGSVQADRGQIEQILMNLAVNARDAMPTGGKLIIETANAELDETYARSHAPVKPGEYVMISVSDTGVGMDANTVSRIFEPFFTTKELGKGTGLGLSIVYGVVKQSGGYIWVYSEPGRGTTFKIYFPRVNAPAAPIEELKPESVPQAGIETILLVEDDEPFRKLALSLLIAAGYTVLEASEPTGALELANQYPEEIHLLLSDVIMPKMSGPELARTLRMSRPEMKIAYMSGYTGDLIADHGALDFHAVLIEKPFTRSSLLKRVRKVLDT